MGARQAHHIVLPCLRYINSDDWVYEAQTGSSQVCPNQGPILSQVSPCVDAWPHTDKAGKQQEGVLPCSTAHHREPAICAALYALAWGCRVANTPALGSLHVVDVGHCIHLDDCLAAQSAADGHRLMRAEDNSDI